MSAATDTAAATATATATLPRPPMPRGRRSQWQTLRALRRNPLELWGPPAFEREILESRLLGRRRLLLNSPAAIRHVLLDNAENYIRPPVSRRVLQPILGDGLLLAEGAAWRHQRRTIAPAFVPRTMPMLARHIVTATAEAERDLDAATAGGAAVVDLYAVLRRLTLNTAGRSMFSLDMDGFGTRLGTMLHRYGERHMGLRMLDLLLPPTMPSPADIGRRAFRAEWRRFMEEIIAARRGAPAGEERDLFDLLLAARDPETGEGFDEDQLRDEVSTLILAGFDTTAVALFWSCYLAARFPEQQERIAAEAAGADLSPEGAGAALEGLHAARAHLMETMRLYPPAFQFLRQAEGADRLPGGVPVGRGDVVSIVPWVLHRPRLLWAEPERYDPARFLPGAPAPDRFAYLPFGGGPRICVGMRLALAEGTLVLARLLRRYRLEFGGDPAVVPLGRVTIQPDRPVPFRLVPR